ncbi:MAG: hypothetical protein M3O70_01325 [Actinomycetota bacterium]|nr:hypothetical protein [Actinomycetota bacterium]
MGYYVEGLTQVELAVLLGTSPGAIKTRLHKARNAARGAAAPQVGQNQLFALLAEGHIRTR